MISDETRAKLSAAGRKGGRVRAAQFTSESQRAARAQVRRESLQANGRLGFARLVEQRGQAFAARIAADYRRDHPSSLEQRTMGWLDELGVSYQREVEVADGAFFIDLVVERAGRSDLAVEVNGAHWHEMNQHHGEDRPARDLIKAEVIRAAGYELLYLSEAVIVDGSGRQLLEQACRVQRERGAV